MVPGYQIRPRPHSNFPSTDSIHVRSNLYQPVYAKVTLSKGQHSSSITQITKTKNSRIGPIYASMAPARRSRRSPNFLRTLANSGWKEPFPGSIQGRTLRVDGTSPKIAKIAIGGWKEPFPGSIQGRTPDALWMKEAEAEEEGDALMLMLLLLFWEKFPP